MNKQSLLSFNKISVEMDRLSYLINKQQIIHQQLQSVFKKDQSHHSDSSSSGLDNIDQYFREYDNPTTKSLPIEDESNTITQMQEEHTEIINTVYRNRLIQECQQDDKESMHDDKSTVILPSLKSPHKKEKEGEFLHAAKLSVANYSSLATDNKNHKKVIFNASKKISTNNATNSMPHEQLETNAYKHHYPKNDSVSKAVEMQSPLSSLKHKRDEAEYENNIKKQIKNKLSKISKIDKQQLTRLQQKKMHKKTQLSSNRKKTKRDLANAKSYTNMPNAKKILSNTNHSTNLGTAKTFGNISCKTLENKKKEMVKKSSQKMSLNQEWKKTTEKVNTKLNRVNICKLQQNIKKVHQKKPQFKDLVSRKEEKDNNKKIERKALDKKTEEFKLNFTELQQAQSAMKRLIEQKQLSREYTKQTEKYLEMMRKMSKDYFQTLIKQCRQPSQEAIFKLKLVTLLLYFFDQFANTSLITHTKIDPKSKDFFTKIAEEEIIEILLRPKKILKIMQRLPNILMSDNVVSSERLEIFYSKFREINDQLDQQLQFFLIKKTYLYMFIHSLSEYMSFLIGKELVGETKRTKLIAIEPEQKIHGFYSNRSRRDEVANKYIKKKQGAYRLGFRCDSDRKITLEDDDIFRGQFQSTKPESNIKTNPLKRMFK